ncbi:response regulator transcription factor [Alkalicoccobacillus porphyridii]|nr:response regulator transcription factor [Alkalicoccobacillus porphyridii]
MMYQVVIVDDEPMIREGLRSLIPWEQYGFSVTEIARNGKEAFEVYQNVKPDLMIVDIRMPEMDGLALIELIRKSDRFTHFIILTGHADFSYAQKALSSRVDGYLLKPLDEEELIGLLNQIHAEIKSRLTVNVLKEKEQLWKREFFIKEALSGPIEKENVEAFDVQWRHYGLQAEMYRIILVTVPESMEKVHAHLSSVTVNKKGALPFSFSTFNGMILFNDAIQSEKETVAYIQSTKGYGAIGKKVTDPQDLYQSYEEAQYLLNQTFLFKEGTCITNEMLAEIQESKTDSRSEFSMDHYVKNLSITITLGHVDSCHSLLKQFTNELIRNKYDPNQIKKNIVHLYSMVVNQLVLNDSRRLKAIESTQFSSSHMYDLHHIHALTDAVIERFTELIRLVYTGGKESTIQRMVDLINKQYDQNLRLETLAELLNYNPAYLGKLFREHTGEYYNTYLDKVRIENGKALLLDGYKVYEVSEKIGYKDVDYFHRKFKKYEGISPRAFQKKQITIK